MSNREEQFQLLEMEPTDDVREIKHAYAKMVRKIHPEEQPDEWEKIHAAYKELVNSVKNKPINRRNNPPAQTRRVNVQVPVQTPQTVITSEPEPVRKTETPETKQLPKKEPVLEPKPKYKKSKLEKEIAHIVKESGKYVEQKINLEELHRILKKIPSPKAWYFGKLSVDKNAMRELRLHPLFFDALADSEFVSELERILEKCYYSSDIANDYLEDFLLCEKRDERLIEILKNKIEESKELEKHHKLKGLFYGGSFLTWLFRDLYNLYDYVRYGATYLIHYDTLIYLGKNRNGYRADLVLEGISYSVLCMQNTLNSTFHVEGIWTSDYESATECLDACVKVSDYYERQYKKHCVLRFLRQLLIIILDGLIFAGVIAGSVSIFFDKGEFGITGILLIMVINVAFKLTTVMGYQGKK